jgi:4-amino-4-deoxy-L-arabinose transferase-like glycosyltransferase
VVKLSHYLLLALVLAIALIALNWVGYDGSDDHSYAVAAENWVNHFPYVGHDHWELRHTIVIPVALSLKLLGPSEFALAFPNVLYFLGFIAVNFCFLRRFINPAFAACVALLLAATPEFVVQATYINIDIAEMFFVSLSFWLFVYSRETPQQPSLFVWAGVAAGFAFLTRETSVALILFYGLCFLFFPAAPRSRYVLMAAGFLAVIGLEIVYLGAMTGDIFYRYRIDVTHDVVDRAREVARVASAGAALDKEGNLSVSVWLDPILMLFVSQKYGLLFYFAIPTAAWACLRGTIPQEHSAIKLLAILALSWILFISLSFPILYLVPRYFIVSAWAGVIVMAYACWRAYLAKAYLRSLVIIAALLVVNGLSLYLENTDPRFAEHALVRYLAAHPGTIHTDPDTANRADLLLQFAGMSGRVSSEPPQAGDIVAYSPLNLDHCWIASCKFDMTLYGNKSGWIELEKIAPKPRRLGAMLRAVKADKVVPPQIIQKIEAPVPGIVIYRVP